MPGLTDVRTEIAAPLVAAQAEVLTADAVRFLGKLAHAFEARRQELLARRRARQQEIDGGKLPDFLPETTALRQESWVVAPIPQDLMDRRVEITGPPERKMVINALNSGASVFMADFEDANTPTWNNNLEGQVNLRDAVNGVISYTSPEGKRYRLTDHPAVLMVRPRGWHLNEKHFRVEGQPISGSLFDFGLFFFHNARALVEKGTGPYFYLPKMESHLEARLWNDVFNFAQDELGFPRGTIRATVLIENILATFEMDEFLYELRDHSAGLNCGRWDYIFSFIKKFRNRPDLILPDRALITMDRHFLHSYVRLLIRTCHRRRIHAMGGMAAQIPIKEDPKANERALEKVRQDKILEVETGHDGTWVAHPGLVAVAREVFDAYMKEPNQIARPVDPVDETPITRADLLRVPEGDITEDGVRHNIDVALQYVTTWLAGSGCVPIYNLMEDAATAEICRAQVWQWVRHGAKLKDGRPVTREMIQEMLAQEAERLRAKIGAAKFDAGKYSVARQILEPIMTGREFPEFLTLVAYDHLD